MLKIMEGTVGKYESARVTENLTTTQYGTILFPADRIVTSARMTNGSLPILVMSTANQDAAVYYVVNGTLAKFGNSTSYSIEYRYLKPLS